MGGKQKEIIYDADGRFFLCVYKATVDVQIRIPSVCHLSYIRAGWSQQLGVKKSHLLYLNTAKSTDDIHLLYLKNAKYEDNSHLLYLKTAKSKDYSHLLFLKTAKYDDSSHLSHLKTGNLKTFSTKGREEKTMYFSYSS